MGARAALIATAAGSSLLLPGTAQAVEAVPEGLLDIIFSTVEHMGAWGPVVYTLGMAVCECVPFLPTQPISLVAGLLFGTQAGAVCIVAGTSLAGFIAFSLARGVGRPLAERVIRAEMTDAGAPGSTGGIQAQLVGAMATIEKGNFWQQSGAVLMLRMTPLLPYSACNYVLGLSPLPLGPYMLGTVTGMTLWSPLYASLGGASRSLLLRGADPAVLMADIMEQAGSLSREVGLVGGVVLVGALTVAFAVARLQPKGTAEPAEAQASDPTFAEPQSSTGSSLDYSETIAEK